MAVSLMPEMRRRQLLELGIDQRQQGILGGLIASADALQERRDVLRVLIQPDIARVN